MADAIAVIPARYASVRFPGKVLADRTGKPLVQHVYERAAAAERVGRVIVAADDPRIVEAVRAFGGEAVLTRDDHRNGTSRIAEVAPSLAAEVIVNVQGDEPDVGPGLRGGDRRLALRRGRGPGRPQHREGRGQRGGAGPLLLAVADPVRP
jgi:3-deoxy-manno-octulosonate cytidylyltransferase (CMP-KDO synthetase)